MEYRKFSTFIDSVQYGYTAEETSATEGDAKYLRITDIVPYFVNKERVPFCKITEEKKKKYVVKENDLLIARTGATTGYNLVVPANFSNYIFASYLIRFHYRQDILFPLYLKYILKSQQYYGFVKNFVGGSAQPGMNPKAFGKFEIPYVDFNIQKKIANILSAYDDLIENNNKRIRTLEQMAENLYKEWFVRFRFPGHETAEFENGLPKGWEIKKFGNTSKISSGGDAPKEYSSVRTQDYSIPVYSNGIANDGLYGFISQGVKGIKSSKSITISARGTVGFVCLRFEPYLPIVRLLTIEPDSKVVDVYYLYYMLKEKNIDGYGTSQQQITIPYFSKKKILIPPVVLQKKYSDFVSDVFMQINKIKEKNENLIKQRDMLLPRLLSGKLGVKE